MKIRTDFVTNSSSSCFCVTLTLQFDNDKDKTIRFSNVNQEGDPDYFDDCGKCGDGSLNKWNIMQNFARLISSKEDKGDLFSALTYMCDASGKKTAYAVWDTEKLTKAELRINACVAGEYQFIADTYRLLGIYSNSDEKHGSVEDEVENLKARGYSAYTDKALETIVLYEDADTEEKYKKRGKEIGIRYGLNNASKSIVAKMNKNGKIDVDIDYGEKYSRGYGRFDSHSTIVMDNVNINEYKLKELDWKLQKVRAKKAELAAKMNNH